MRELRKAQPRLLPAELEALIADDEAGGRVGEGVGASSHDGRGARGSADKTRPVMTEAQIDEGVVLYRDGWTLHDMGQHFGVADQKRGGLTLTLGEPADLFGNCYVDEERARGSDEHRRVRQTVAAIGQGAAAL